MCLTIMFNDSFCSNYLGVSSNDGTQQLLVSLLKMTILGCFGGTIIFGSIHIFGGSGFIPSQQRCEPAWTEHLVCDRYWWFTETGIQVQPCQWKTTARRSCFPHFHWRLIQHLESQGKCTVKCFLQTTHIHIYTSVAKCFEGSEQSTYPKLFLYTVETITPFINRQQISKPFKVQSHQQQHLSISKYMI